MKTNDNNIEELLMIDNEYILSRVKTHEINLNILNEFMKKFAFEKNRLPYHINILDLIWANENAHSRIFGKILEQNSNGEFELLDSFILFLNEKYGNVFPLFKSPVISVEKERIDLLISDPVNTLIIENKIHGALDQKSQIARYIQKMRDKGYVDSNIFIFYLTKDGSKIEEDYSWDFDSNSLKDDFSNRFIRISYRYDILPFLKDWILPSCRLKDIYLRSCIEQYIDYLEGVFYLRKNDIQMNNNLQNLLHEKLELTNSLDKNREILEDKLQDFQEIEKTLREMILENKKEYFKSWINRIRADFPDIETIDLSGEDWLKKVGVILSQNDMKFSVLIETNEQNGNIYYGLGIHYCSEDKFEQIQVYFKDLCKIGFITDNNKYWYFWRYTDFSNGYIDLKSLIEKVVKMIS